MAVPIPQTTVKDFLSRPFPGVVADTSFNLHTESKVSAEASAEIPFGVAVIRDDTDKDDGVVLPTTSSAVSAPRFAGVVQHTHAMDKPNELGAAGITPKSTVLVMTEGRIWVLPEEAVTPGDAVRFRAVVAGMEQAGAFRTTADGTDCVNISNLARWVRGGDSTTPAILEIDMSNAAQAVADT